MPQVAAANCVPAVDPQTPAFDPSPLKLYFESLGVACSPLPGSLLTSVHTGALLLRIASHYRQGKYSNDKPRPAGKGSKENLDLFVLLSDEARGKGEGTGLEW